MTIRISVMNENVLTVNNLNKFYGQKSAVKDLNFFVKKNEIVGLLGTNGAGKTTTINMILGVLKPSSGMIEIGGHDVHKNHGRALKAANFAAVYAPLPGNMTVYQNLKFFGLIYKVSNLKDKIDELINEFDLQRFVNTKCGLLSSGEQVRVCLAKSMLNSPELLLLDEPTASLDPSTAQSIRQKIKTFAKEKSGGVLWTSHNMYEVEEVCDRVLFLYKGQIIMEGNPRSLPQAHGVSSLEDLFITVAREQLAVGM